MNLLGDIVIERMSPATYTSAYVAFLLGQFTPAVSWLRTIAAAAPYRHCYKHLNTVIDNIDDHHFGNLGQHSCRKSR